MAKIYDSAYQIHAWLGPGTDETVAAVQKIAKMFGTTQELVRKNDNNPSQGFAQVTPRNPSFFNASDPSDRENWEVIFKLLEVP
jgi:hypothetical protein